jgi:hypothetical protein
MSTNGSWPASGGPLTLDQADERLSAVVDFLRLHNPSPGQALVVQAIPGVEVASLKGQVDAWGSTETDLEFSWFPDTERVKRIALSKPIDVFEGISLPFLRISDLRQHCAAELRSADGDGMAYYTGGMRGIVHLGEHLIAFDLEGYGRPSYDLRIDFAAVNGIAQQPPGLRDLAAFLGLMDDPHADLQWLPAELQSADLITLKALNARIEPADPRKLTWVEVTLGFLRPASQELV